jgi:spore maturation protein CgeB
VLNVTRASGVRYGFCPSTRIFEAAGAGACLVTDAWQGIEHFLEPEREVLVARDGADVADQVRSLTAARARAIGEAARRRVRAHHTYAHRAGYVEALLRGASTAVREAS